MLHHSAMPNQTSCDTLQPYHSSEEQDAFCIIPYGILVQRVCNVFSGSLHIHPGISFILYPQFDTIVAAGAADTHAQQNQNQLHMH